MADWIKIRHSLLRSPKLRGLMRELKCNKHTALGLAVEWLCWIDEQTENGETGLTPDELADELGFRGCAEALCSVGWAALGDDGTVKALEFGKHCGDSAKKRAEDAMRKSLSRLRRAGKEKTEAENVTEKCDKCHENNVTNVTNFCDKCHANHVTRKEENRIEDNNKNKVHSNSHPKITSTLLPYARESEEPVAFSTPKPEEVAEYIRKLPLLKLTDQQREECSESFFNECEERGWMTKYGTPVPIRNWKAAAKRYAESWARRREEVPPRGGGGGNEGKKWNIPGAVDKGREQYRNL